MATRAPIEQFLEKALAEFEQDRQQKTWSRGQSNFECVAHDSSSHSSWVSRQQRANA